MKHLIKSIINFFGFEIKRINEIQLKNGIYSELSNLNIINLEYLAKYNSFIDGMITDYQGKILFLLCYFQNLSGDVLEIGSFKGKSTSFIFNAVSASNNGKLFVIDHFEGVPGKEKLYGSFKNDFENNMLKIGAKEKIKILNGASRKMLKKIKSNSLRFIYIDGDHSYNGIRNDLITSLEKIKKGGLIILDDYFNGFPELVRSVNEIIKENKNFQLLTFSHNLIIKKNYS